jgi:serine/threonine protein kinase
MELQEQLATALGDRYRVERELGHGGMAVVFLAEDLKHRRPVAIKVLKPELSAVLGSERFLREIAIAATLQHPHILPLYDSGQAGSLLYYVMPFVEGESLRQRLAREQPRLRGALDGAGLPPDRSAARPVAG